MKDQIWYREELLALQACVRATMRDEHDATSLLALGHLDMKLERQLATAPSARTPTGES